MYVCILSNHAYGGDTCVSEWYTHGGDMCVTCVSESNPHGGDMCEWIIHTWRNIAIGLCAVKEMKMRERGREREREREILDNDDRVALVTKLLLLIETKFHPYKIHTTHAHTDLFQSSPRRLWDFSFWLCRRSRQDSDCRCCPTLEDVYHTMESCGSWTC